VALFVYHLYSFASLLLAFETVVVAMVAAVSSHQNETRRGRCFSSVEEALLSSIARVAEAETCAPRRLAISMRLSSSSSSSSSFSRYSLTSARASRVPSSAFGFPATPRGDSFLTEEEEEEKEEEEEEEEDDFLMKTKPAMMMMMMMRKRRRRTTTVAALAEVDSPSCLSLARDQRKTTKVGGPTSRLVSPFVACAYFFIFVFLFFSLFCHRKRDVADLCFTSLLT
jgi:hypothetical protein